MQLTAHFESCEKAKKKERLYYGGDPNVKKTDRQTDRQTERAAVYLSCVSTDRGDTYRQTELYLIVGGLVRKQAQHMQR